MENSFENFVGLDRPKEEIKLWVEKYRPKTLDEFIGNDLIVNHVKRFIQDGEVTNHILFHGPPGTGKTTLAKILVSSLDCDVLSVNASNETRIEFVREKIQPFCTTIGFRKFKIVFLDECDFMSINSQGMLRNLLEKHSSHARFILTCNYLHKVLDAIQSRCQVFEVIPNNPRNEMVRLANILTSEGIKFDPNSVAELVKRFHPDMRKTINSAQQYSLSGELKLVDVSSVGTNFKAKLVDILKRKNKGAFVEIRQLIADAGVGEFSDLYTYLYDVVSEYSAGKEPLAICTIAECLFQSGVVIPSPVAQEIVFMSLINKLLQL